MNRIVLEAKEGFIYTDGDIYGKIVFLAENINPNTFYEITEEEYLEILKKQEEEYESL
jgi:hypothetical protein